jgi:hypothetical protein
MDNSRKSEQNGFVGEFESIDKRGRRVNASTISLLILSGFPTLLLYSAVLSLTQIGRLVIIEFVSAMVAGTPRPANRRGK